MSSFQIRQGPCALDFLALGALVHRLDPGVVPFRKARSFEIHVSGGEYNVAAGLSAQKLSHVEVLEAGKQVAGQLERLIRGVLKRLSP